MIKILFVCHGNICRSPMAEFVLKDMVRRAGIADGFEIASAATSSEELGNPVYPPARRKLAEHGIGCAGKTARRIRRDDYDAYDLLLGFDQANLRNMERCFGGDPEGKIHLMTEYVGEPDAIIDDPWYTRDFDRAWEDIHTCCLALLNTLHPEVTLDFSACRERAALGFLRPQPRRALRYRDGTAPPREVLSHRPSVPGRALPRLCRDHRAGARRRGRSDRSRGITKRESSRRNFPVFFSIFRTAGR